MIQPPNTTEQHLQKNSLKLLQQLGYTFISQEDNQHFRNKNLHEVVLKNIAIEQLAKINRYTYKGQTFEFSRADIQTQINQMNDLLAGGLMATNKKITERLLFGTSIEQDLPDGSRKSFSFHFIDWHQINNNALHVTEEFSVQRIKQTEVTKTRRADIVLFINGFPLVIFELKKSDVTISKGISQLITYQQDNEIPKLFSFAQLLIAANHHTAYYATPGSPSQYYLTWQEEYANIQNQCQQLVTARQPNTLDQLIVSLCQPERLFEFIRFFILFDNNIKKIARYQQYYAVQSIIKKVGHDGQTQPREGGLIWHTQGSGKSLTMVMATKYLQKKIQKAKIIVVTDRINLDKQISQTFADTEIDVQHAKTGTHLMDLLYSGASVITATIHKFETATRQRCQLDNPNIFILVDESHRTQSGQLHRAMKKVFVSGCYIGFTGTPLLKSQKKDGSIAQFNGLIHQYTIDQAVKDQAVLPLLYESRMVDQWITDNEALDQRFKRYTKDLTELQRQDLERKWANFRHVASSRQRLEIIVFDIEDHFQKNVQGKGFKAILATNSKIEAIQYQQFFDHNDILNTAVSISAPNVTEGNQDSNNENRKLIQSYWQQMLDAYGSEKNYDDYIESEFKTSDGAIDLLIVVDKMLTGFDAPVAQVLYIDKELKNHNLLQAVARVNRVYPGKEYGLIIDYRGLFENLDQALTSYHALAGYDEVDVQGTFTDVKESLQKLKTSFSQLQDLFVGIAHPNDQESYAVALDTTDKRQTFYQALKRFSKDLSFALGCEYVNKIYSDDDLNNFKKWLKFYDTLRRSLKIRYAETVDFAQYEQQMQQLLDTFVGTKSTMLQLNQPMDLFSKDFAKQVDTLGTDHAKADAMANATTKYAQEKRESNPVFYDKISEKIDQIIQDYKDKRLSEQEYLNKAKNVLDQVRQHDQSNAANYPASINTNPKRAFYDTLQTYLTLQPTSEMYLDFVCFLDQLFKQYIKKPNWKENIDVKNAIEQNLEDYCYNHHLTVAGGSELDDLLAKSYELGVHNYD